MEKDNEYEKIKYNRSLIMRKKQLEKELEYIKEILNVEAKKCDHVSVCLGFNGLHQYRDTSIFECLLCRETNPESNYPIIDATYYRDDLYNHGMLSNHREEKMDDLQKVAMLLYDNNPTLTNEELVAEMNKVVNKNMIKKINR